MNSVVELQQVEKHYGNIHAIENVTLSLNEGEILGLLGHNGAGKTTTMKLILGVISATAGSVQLFGKSPIGPHADTLRRNMGYLPENVSFYNQLSGREVLDYFAELKGISVRARNELLERVGLGHAADRRVKTYSKGMRQRLGVAQALLGQPRLLLLDEPTAGLDPAATNEFYSILDELRNQGSTVLLSSHVLPGIEKHVDRVAILGKGKLLANGTLDDLNRQAQLPLTFHVRGMWPEMDWHKQLSEHDIEFQHVNGQRLELNGSQESKLDIMRSLLAVPEVDDVEVIHPTLDTLYAYYNKQNNQVTSP